jgi:CHASE2 domain-containing sensor protein
LKTARTPLVLGALDERGELTAERRDFQAAFLADAGRPAGFLNLRVEKDGVVRYGARPADNSKYPASFARLLAEAAGFKADDDGAPISWSLPGEGSEVFTKVLAHDLLGANAAAEQAKLANRIVLIGGDYPLPPRDRHRVPLSVRDGEPIAGVAVHAHILAGLIAPETAIRELSPGATDALLLGLGAAGFVIGWQLWQSTWVGFLRWTFATLLLIGLDALAFVAFKLLLPFTLALVAWFAGVTAGSALHAAWRSRDPPAAPVSRTKSS